MGVLLVIIYWIFFEPFWDGDVEVDPSVGESYM